MSAPRSGHVVVAPAHFKDALSAPRAARAIAAGVRLVAPDVETVERPTADGGEGTLDALVLAGGGSTRRVGVRDPLGRPVAAELGLVPGGTAVIEMARASGIELLEHRERDPLVTSTLGVGDLIREALELGAKRIVIGLGGSATNDGGLGAAHALGARFLDRQGEQLLPAGANLGEIAAIDLADLDPRIHDVEIDLACDVDVPFHGPGGAAETFGPQKGADASAVAHLDRGLAHVAELLGATTGAQVQAMPHAGAAGGTAGGLAALVGARPMAGAALVIEASGLEADLSGAALCVTGEGRLDEQTVRGKAPAAVAKAAGEAGVPCVALVGQLRLGPRLIRELGLLAAFSIGREPRVLEEALSSTEADLAAAGAAIGGLARLEPSGERRRPSRPSGPWKLEG